MAANGTLRGSAEAVGSAFAGPTLLFVHPLGTGPDFWLSVTRHLSGFGWIAPDFRPDPDATEAVTLDRQADRLEAERARQDAASCIVIGCAAGAMIAAVHAARHPETTVGVMFVNPAPRNGGPTDAALAARAALVREKGMAALAPALVDRIFSGAPKDAAYQAFTYQLLRQDPESYARFLLSFQGADVVASLKAIAAPALVVRGENDVMASDDDARAVHALMQRSRFVVLRDAAHFPPLQVPQAFASLIADLAADVAPAPGRSGPR